MIRMTKIANTFPISMVIRNGDSSNPDDSQDDCDSERNYVIRIPIHMIWMTCDSHETSHDSNDAHISENKNIVRVKHLNLQ